MPCSTCPTSGHDLIAKGSGLEDWFIGQAHVFEKDTYGILRPKYRVSPAREVAAQAL